MDDKYFFKYDSANDFSDDIADNYLKSMLAYCDSEEYSSEIDYCLNQFFLFKDFYQNKRNISHEIEPGIPPIVYQDDYLNVCEDHFFEKRMILDARAKQLEDCTDLSEKEISRACTQHLIFQSDGVVPEKEIELYRPFIQRVFFQLLENNWINESSKINYKSGAFKLHTNKLWHGNSGEYHLDNDCDVVKCLIYPFDRNSQDGAFTYRENINLDPRDASIIYPFLQRGKAQMSQVFAKESALQSLLRCTNTRSVSFLQNRDLFLNLLTKNSEIVVPYRRSTVILFKGDTTFHKGGNVVTEPRYSIQILFKIT